jgi:hypothetical protein
VQHAEILRASRRPRGFRPGAHLRVPVFHVFAPKGFINGDLGGVTYPVISLMLLPLFLLATEVIGAKRAEEK